jgi:hypothetical protein
VCAIGPLLVVLLHARGAGSIELVGMVAVWASYQDARLMTRRLRGNLARNSPGICHWQHSRHLLSLEPLCFMIEEIEMDEPGSWRSPRAAYHPFSRTPMFA